MNSIKNYYGTVDDEGTEINEDNQEPYFECKDCGFTPHYYNMRYDCFICSKCRSLK